MPIPEPGLYRPSTLTAEQQHKELSAVYGVPMLQELTHEEVQRMRQIVQQFDAERKPMQTIDLNNPPKEPYRRQPFPQMVYDLEKSRPGEIKFRIVANQGELELSLAEGWSEEAPAFGDESEQPLSAALQIEAAQAQEKIEKAHRGRPPKVA